jgi:hypothetical protein
MNANVKKPAKKSSPVRRPKPGLAGELELPGSNTRLEKYVLSLYVSGSTSKSALAVENIKPTLIKRSPLPLRRLIGDLSDLKKVLFGLDLRMPKE